MGIKKGTMSNIKKGTMSNNKKKKKTGIEPSLVSKSLLFETTLPKKQRKEEKS